MLYAFILLLQVLVICLKSFCYKVISITWLSRAHTSVYYYRFYIVKFLTYEVSCLITLKSRLGLEAMMSRLVSVGSVLVPAKSFCPR